MDLLGTDYDLRQGFLLKFWIRRVGGERGIVRKMSGELLANS